MSLYRDEAVVLRTWKLGEADRIVGLHTRRHGKVRGVAKGVRRTRSKFGARLEPMSHVAVQLHRGRSELETVTQVETIHRFTGLRSDPVRFARGSALLEAVDRIAPDREPDPDRHQMLVGALAAADRDDSPLLVAAFMLKLLAHDGVRPTLDACVSCGSDGPLETIGLESGGATCRRCRSGRPVSPVGLELLRQIFGGELAAALRQPPGKATAEVEELARTAFESHVERRLRSMAVLERTRR